MNKEDLGALKSLYQGMFSSTPSNSTCDKPTVTKTITDGLGIYESQIKSVEVKDSRKQVVLSEETSVVRQVISSTPSTTPLRNNTSILGNSQWGSSATIKDISELYTSIYEEKDKEEDEDEGDEEDKEKEENKKGKKKDQDEDGDNDFADVRIARMIASGMSKAEAIAAVKNKEYNEEFVTEDPIQDFRDMRRASENKGGARGPELSHGGPSKGTLKPGSAIATKQPRSREFSREVSSSTSRNTTGPSSPGYDTRRLGGSDLRRLTNSFEFESWVDSLVEEGYDLSDYTWEEMFDIYLDEATRMRKELGKEGEIATRKELAARSKAYKRSGSVDKTIAAAERGADRPYIKYKRDESDADRKKREEKQSRTLRGLAASRRGSVRDKPRAGMRGYASKVEGGDKDLQSARQGAMSAGTLTPKEKKQLGEVYEVVASYLLENNFAATLNDANVIIENMSEVWLSEILESVE